MQAIDRYELRTARYAIAPGWGCNLVSWVMDGQELVYCPPSLPAEATSITGGGVPILFPAVGRTWDHSSGQPVPGKYRIHGSETTYSMPPHGIVFLSRFRKVKETASADEVTADYELAVPNSVRNENYPFDVRLAQRFSFRPRSVEMEATVINEGRGPAPVAFGYHPYFRVSSPSREGVEVHLPATKHLFVTDDTVLLTGESEETDGILKLRAGAAYDDVFGGLTGQRASLVDRRAGRMICVDYSDLFELLVVYAPDGADFVCLEPWTRGLGGFEDLARPGWHDGERIPVLGPGESRRLRCAFSVERLGQAF